MPFRLHSELGTHLLGSHKYNTKGARAQQTHMHGKFRTSSFLEQLQLAVDSLPRGWDVLHLSLNTSLAKKLKAGYNDGDSRVFVYYDERGRVAHSWPSMLTPGKR